MSRKRLGCGHSCELYAGPHYRKRELLPGLRRATQRDVEEAMLGLRLTTEAILDRARAAAADRARHCDRERVLLAEVEELRGRVSGLEAAAAATATDPRSLRNQLRVLAGEVATAQAAERKAKEALAELKAENDELRRKLEVSTPAQGELADEADLVVAHRKQGDFLVMKDDRRDPEYYTMLPIVVGYDEVLSRLRNYFSKKIA